MKGTIKVPAVDLLRLSILRGSTFIASKCYDEQLRPFKDVRAKIFYSIDFFFNFYCGQIMSTCLGVTGFVSEKRRVEN